MPGLGQRTVKWADDVGKVVRVAVRVHGAAAAADDRAPLFVVNRVTGLETILVAAHLHRDFGLEARPLVPEGLLDGPLGEPLRAAGALATQAETKVQTIAAALLRGTPAWVVFAAGDGGRSPTRAPGRWRLPDGWWPKRMGRPARTSPPRRGGPAAMALRAEFVRHTIGCLSRRPYYEQLEKVLRRFDLDSCEEALSKRTVLVPVNVTYFPLRPRKHPSRSDDGEKGEAPHGDATPEGSVEAPFELEGTEVDIRLGQPMAVRPFLERPEYAQALANGAPGGDLARQDPEALLEQATTDLTRACAAATRDGTTVNCDHVFASLLRHQWRKSFPEPQFRARAFLCAHELEDRLNGRLHGAFGEACRALLNGDSNRRFDDFLELCVHEGALQKQGRTFRTPPASTAAGGATDADETRRLSTAIADELEPLEGAVARVKRAARLPGPFVTRRLRAMLIEEDRRRFAEDYAAHYEEGATKETVVGSPFLLKPLLPRAGVVLVHGYMAAPLEVRALAEHLYRRRYAVYAVRLKGHGTSPPDLARTTWEDWYASVNDGCAIMGTMTDRVVLGGFSMGAGLALLAAGRKREHVAAVFAIDAPLHLRSPAARLAPSVVRVNALLRKLHWPRPQWEYVANDPENRHINYTLNPVSGVAELAEAMHAMVEVLPDITAPTLLLYGSGDPVVHPNSGQAIFDKVGTPFKELDVMCRDRHGIINGPGSVAVFERVCQFLAWARDAGRTGSV